MKTYLLSKNGAKKNNFILLANIYGIYGTDTLRDHRFPVVSKCLGGSKLKLMWEDDAYRAQHDGYLYIWLRGEYNGYVQWYGKCGFPQPGIFAPGDIPNFLAYHDEITRKDWVSIDDVLKYLVITLYKSKYSLYIAASMLNQELAIYDFRTIEKDLLVLGKYKDKELVFI